ncbi:MAG: zinc ribbon domain-containing protein [Caldilineaceae bacterium]
MSEVTKICPHCGSSVMEDANFCPRCGTDLRAEGTQQAESLTPPEATSTSSLTAAPNETKPQPKSERTTDPAENRSSSVPAPSTEPEAAEGTMLDSLTGLLDPIGMGSRWGDELPSLPDRRVAERHAADELRRIRYRMLQEPTLSPLVQPIPPSHGVYRVYWIFGLLLLALIVPFFWPSNGPTTVTQPGLGAKSAYDAIQSLPENADALLFWAYDPATAGEMDQVAYPVIRHLLERGSHMTVITLLPGGAATAQQLIAQVVANDSELKQGDTLAMSQLVSLHFVPGGIAALPYIAKATCSSDLCRRTVSDDGLLPLNFCPSNGCDFKLAIVVTAQAEDGQQWLEVARPLNALNVVMVSSAAANLPLQPYFSSGQLIGLVGGFDGAANYLQSKTILLKDSEWSIRWQRLYELRWGHIALIVVIFLGNLVAMGRMPGTGSGTEGLSTGKVEDKA